MRIAWTFLLIVAAAVGGWYLGTQYGSPSESANAQRPVGTSEPIPQTAIRGIGKLEPRSGVLKIMAPVGQRVQSLYNLQIGSDVDVDQPIVELAGTEKAEMELQIAVAKKADALKKESVEKAQGRLQRQTADLALEEARSSRRDVASKSKGIDLLRAQLEKANEMLQSLQNLKSDPATKRLVGKADIDKQQLVVQQLETRMAQSEDEVRLALEKIERAEKGAELDIARVDSMLNESALPVQSIDAAINAAQKSLEMLEIKSPISGTVLDIVVRPGDTATNQPVMLIGDTSVMVCVAEINDSSLINVEIGAAATLTSTAIAEPLTGKVVSKGVMIGPPSMNDPNPFASVDRKTGRVVIALDDSTSARQFVNLQVDVAIELKQDTN